MAALDSVRVPVPDFVSPPLPVMGAVIVPVLVELTVTMPSAEPKSKAPVVPLGLIVAFSVNSKAPLVSVRVNPSLIVSADALAKETTSELTLAVALATVAAVMRVLVPEVTALFVNSSVGFKGRSPAVAFQVTKVLGVPPAVPMPPVVGVASPTRNGTLLVSLFAALMPVTAPSVAPTSVGEETRNLATLVVAESFLPNPMPLTSRVPAPADRVRVPAVTSALLVEPKVTVAVDWPLIRLRFPIVSEELVPAVLNPL